MANLKVVYQNIKDGRVINDSKPHTVGYSALFVNSNKIISIDGYSGYADTYKEREEPIICVFDDGEVVFEGTREQLINKLKK